MAALADSTQQAYLHSLQVLVPYITQELKLTWSLPITTPQAAGFIAYLFDKCLAPSSIRSYLSAISYIHKLLHLPDPTDSFTTCKLMKGAPRLAAAPDQQLPVTPRILQALIHALDHIVTLDIQRCMLKAVMLLAFAAFLRSGKLVSRTKNSLVHALQLHDVASTTLGTLIITMRNFKHNLYQQPITLYVSPAHHGPCAVHALQFFLELR